METIEKKLIEILNDRYLCEKYQVNYSNPDVQKLRIDLYLLSMKGGYTTNGN